MFVTNLLNRRKRGLQWSRFSFMICMKWILFVQVVLFGVAYFPLCGQQVILSGYVLPQVKYQGIFGGSEKYGERSHSFGFRSEDGRFRYFWEAEIARWNDLFWNSLAISSHIILVDFALRLSFWRNLDPARQNEFRIIRRLSGHFEAITNDLTGLQVGIFQVSL